MKNIHLIPTDKPSRLDEKRSKQETLDEAAGILSKRPNVKDFDLRPYGYIGALLNYIKLLEEYTKWEQKQDKNKYSKEEVESIWKFALYSAEQHDKFGTKNKSNFIRKDVEEFIEQFKKK
jgi:hypothetical protein